MFIIANTIFYLIMASQVYHSTSAKLIDYIENFTENETKISQWIEHSDTIRPEGKSKASLVIQETQDSKKAILFTLLNPQPCGAAFAGIKKTVTLNLISYDSISLKVRGQGQFKGYKFILRHFGEDSEKYPAFCNFFEAPSDNFGVVTLKLEDFKPYLEGKLVKDTSIVLNKSNITSLGILAYGGVYLPTKQSGVASLEIEWIKKGANNL